MIERLNQITLNDFIELSCGNYACLLSGRGSVSESMLKEMASKLIIEYRSIVNPSGMQAMIMDKEDMVKERAKLLSLRICQTLVSLGFYDDVRQVLGQLNVDIRDMSDEQVISKLDYLLHSAIFEQKRNEERRSEEHKGSKATPEQIRSSFEHEEGALLYIYQADRMKLLDLSEISLSSTVSFSAMQLVETLILGSDTHTEQSIGSYAPLTSLNCGEMPFLVSLDIRRTQIATLVTDKCPRIAHINASGSKLENITLAETSPINDISLPATMTSLRFVGLPELTYTGLSAPSGLQIESMPNVGRLRLETSPKLNAIQMLRDVLASQTASRKLSMLRISNMTLKADGSELLAILEYGVAGMDEDGNRQDKPVVNGTYHLTVIRETDEIESLESGIDGLVILTVIDAYIDLINWFNNESYGGEPYYDNVTLDNINEVLEYYNGETYEEYLERFAEDNMDINDLINK